MEAYQNVSWQHITPATEGEMEKACGKRMLFRKRVAYHSGCAIELITVDWINDPRIESHQTNWKLKFYKSIK